MNSDPELEFVVKRLIRAIGDPRPFLCEPDTNPPIPPGILEAMRANPHKSLTEDEKQRIQDAVQWQDDRFDQPVLVSPPVEDAVPSVESE